MPLHSYKESDPTSLKDSLRSIDDYVTHLIYKRSFYPGDFILSGSTSSIINSKVPVIVFATGADNYAYANLEHPSYWVEGELHLTVFYSGDNTSGDMVIQGSVTPVGENGNLFSETQSSVSTTAGPPTNANELESELIQPFDVNAGDDVIAIRLGRLGTDGSDTNAGNLYVTSVNVKYYPERI